MDAARAHQPARRHEPRRNRRHQARRERALWSDADRALLAACDDLHARQFISNETWSALAAHFSERQCMDVVFTAGQYTQVCMMLNTFGVQLDEGQTLDPDLDMRP